MKKITILAIAATTLGLYSCNTDKASAKIDEQNVETTATTTANADNNPTSETTTATPAAGFAKMTVDREEHDFGEMKKGEKGETEFVITNTGDADLVIIDARATCGCTVPEKPQQPIKPGQSDKIKVAFNASSAGMQNKQVTLTTNTEEGKKVLRIKANVTQ